MRANSLKGCVFLSYLALGANVVVIESTALAGCRSLTTVVLSVDLAVLTKPAKTGTALDYFNCDDGCECESGAGYVNSTDNPLLFSCEGCVAGRYKESLSDKACSLCASGKMMSESISASKSESDCEPCRPGMYQLTAGGTKCEPSLPGYYCLLYTSPSPRD